VSDDDCPERLISDLTEEEVLAFERNVSAATDWINAYLMEAAIHEENAHPPGSPKTLALCLSQAQVRMVHSLLQEWNLATTIAVMMDALYEAQKGVK
jgi:hypothetical protein